MYCYFNKFVTLLILSNCLVSTNAYSKNNILNKKARGYVYKQLEQVPQMRRVLWNILYSKPSKLTPNLRSEIEGMLKIAFFQTDTKVINLTSKIAEELNVPSNVSAFHKQLPPHLQISIKYSNNYVRTNNNIRNMVNDDLFTDAHNLFIKDIPITRELNSVIFFLHELSHAALDYYLENDYKKVKKKLKGFLPEKLVKKVYSRLDGTVIIDEQLYDFLTEQYAFELEYRVNKDLILSMPESWVPWNRFSDLDPTPVKNGIFTRLFKKAESSNEIEKVDYKEVIRSFVRLHYDITDNYLLNLSPDILSYLLSPYSIKVNSKLSCKSLLKNITSHKD